MNRFNLLAIASFSSLLFLPTTYAGTFNQSNHPTSVLVNNTLSQAQIRQLAQAITVKVLSANKGGSGILISKQGQTYTILTNAHVIRSKGHHRIQTPDGKIHPAVVINQGHSLEGNDLALLQFKAKETYHIVPLASAAKLSENQEVFAAGFPYDSQELAFGSGKISLLSPQPLVGGYQIGYTNKIQQGMSGGPLLNQSGKLIGVNGLLNHAILNDTYVYQDGSRPSEQQLQRLREFSFAVPIQTLAQVAPNLAIIPPQWRNQQQASQPTVGNNLVEQVDRIAQQITVRIDSKNNGNGSGVIIAHQGQTYYVVTARHVVENPDSYEIVTPDGQRYAVKQENIKKPQGLDAALLQFTSNKTYSVATLAKYNLSPDKKQWVFLSGFPGTAGGKRKFTVGFRLSREVGLLRAEGSGDLRSLIDNAYGLIYSNLTLHGMSGGPVLDSMGQVIGINAGNELKAVSSTVELGMGLGVPSSTVLGLATNARLKPESLKVVTAEPPNLTQAEINSLQTHPLSSIEKPTENANEYDWLNYGNQLWRLERFDEAVSALQQAIKLKPDFYQAYHALGWVLSSQNKNLEAVAAFEQATKINSDYYQAWAAKSRVLRDLKKYPEALAAIDQAIEKNDDDYDLYIDRGITLSYLKRNSEAMEAITKAIEKQPLFFAYASRGLIRINLKDYHSAIADINKALELQPDYVLAYSLRGLVRYQLKDFKKAQADLNQAIKLQHNFALAYWIRGLVRYELKDPKGTLDDYNQAIKLDPDNAIAYFYRGFARNELKDYQGAIADYNQAIKLDPHNANYYSNRGRVRFAMNDPKGAIADCNQAIKVEPNEAFGYSCRGNVRFGLKDLQGALLDYNQAIKLQPDNVANYGSRGLVRNELKDYQGALFDFNQAIKLQPDFALAYSIRGGIRKDLKDYQGAINDYGQAIKLKPDNAEAYRLQGDVRKDLKDYQGAIADYTQVIKIEPENPQTYLVRGFTYHKLRDYNAALSDYNQALVLDKNFLPALVNIGAIKYENRDVQGAIGQWHKAVKINSSVAEPQLAMAVALYAQGEQQKGLNMAEAALRLDKSWADVKFLKENLWGARLVADAEKLLSNPRMQAFLKQ